MKPDLKNCPVHTSHACVAGYLADGGFGDAESGTDLAGAQCPGVQQLQCVSYFAHGDPGCGHRWFRSKNRSAYAAFGSLRTPRRCPPSIWNAVRLQHGTVSTITLEHCPPSAWNRVRHRVEYATTDQSPSVVGRGGCELDAASLTAAEVGKRCRRHCICEEGTQSSAHKVDVAARSFIQFFCHLHPLF